VKRNIVLMGFMGVGKTSVGRELALRLKREFVDLDELLEVKLGVSITEFFAAKGEAAFRKLEKEAIRSLAQKRGLVLATGGGAVLDPENVRALREKGVLILLTAEPETIAQRLAGDLSRPLLGPDASVERIGKLLAQREAAYQAAAKVEIATDHLTPDQVAEEIVRCLRTESGT
jgi:shikimate kinase